MNHFRKCVGFALLIVNLAECRKDSDDYSYSEQSEESKEYGKLLDLRGTLRKRFAPIAALRYSDISSVCSPISALLPLGKMALGAHGQSLKELNKVIGISHHDSHDFGFVQDEEDSLKTHLTALVKDLEDIPGVVLNVASRLYVSEEKELYKNYTQAVQKIFKTSVERTNFKDRHAAASSINHWVSYQTLGMIREIISPADIQSHSASLIAINAVFFCGHWDEPFPKVEPKPFYSPNGVKNIPMMRDTQWLNYKRSKSLAAELIEIPYSGRKSTFLIVLPKSKSGLPKLLDRLKRKPDLLGKAMKKMQNLKLKLSFPKFRTESVWNLKALYNEVGVSSIFRRSGSGLTSIVHGEELEVSNAIQKAVIEVNELGTKGAAASGLMFISDMKPIEVTVNRPFVFYVLANSQQVFAGVIYGLVIENFMDSRRDRVHDRSVRDEVGEIDIYENVFDLRGTLRQRFGLTAALQYPEISSICSPISALLPLGKLALGADGSSRKELYKAIGIKKQKGDGAETLKAHLSSLIKDLQYLPGVTLDVASKLYISEEKKLNKEFAKLAKSVFNSSIEKTRFNNPKEAASIINHWVSHQTHGMIWDLISPGTITPSTSLVIVNAIYFAGKWERVFSQVEPGPFHSPNGVKNIPMMTQTDYYNYGESEPLSAMLVEIPYIEKKSSFLIVLPKENDGLENLLNLIKIKPRLLGEAMREMKSANVKLTIPKFKTESQWDLKLLYQELGLKSIFRSDTSGLTGIVQNENLPVSAAIQKAVIEVTEQGTKAAAASVVITTFINVNLTECKKKKTRPPKSEESVEFAGFTAVFDLRGTLRRSFGLVAAQKDPQVSAVCSPVSALLALGKLSIGAQGDGFTELNHAIGVKPHQHVDSDYEDYDETQDDRSLKRHLMGIIENLEELQDVTIDLANRLYVSEDKKIFKNFTKVSTRIFKTAMEKANFSNPGAAAASINNWVSFQTHGMITDLLRPADIAANTSVVMVNAVYFSGKWKHSFNKAEQGDFFTPKGIKKVPMMSITQWYNYVDSNLMSARILEIPYAGKGSSFLIVLPRRKDELHLLLQMLRKKPHLLPIEMRRMQSTHIKLSIPKFKIQSQWDLKNLFKKIGLRTIFKSKGSGLTGIVRSEELEISRAVQKVAIDVSETGTEAAAASALLNIATMFLGGIELRVNSPFLFYVLTDSQQLFAGIYN